jgi:hypothetical protein
MTTALLRECNEYLRTNNFAFLNAKAEPETPINLWSALHKAAIVARSLHDDIAKSQQHYHNNRDKRTGLPDEAAIFSKRFANLKDFEKSERAALEFLVKKSADCNNLVVLDEFVPIVDVASLGKAIRKIRKVLSDLNDNYLISHSNFFGTTWTLGKYIEWFEDRSKQVQMKAFENTLNSNGSKVGSPENDDLQHFQKGCIEALAKIIKKMRSNCKVQYGQGIIVKIETTETIQRAIKTFEKEFKAEVNAVEILFGDCEGKETNIANNKVKISIKPIEAETTE